MRDTLHDLEVLLSIHKDEEVTRLKLKGSLNAISFKG